jgi:predicted ATP-grasp superfamily ATP-dependent carboligase
VEDFDLASSYRYRRDGRLTIGQWMRSLSGVRETAYLSLDDPVPLLPRCASDTRKVLRWLSRRATGSVRGSSG